MIWQPWPYALYRRFGCFTHIILYIFLNNQHFIIHRWSAWNNNIKALILRQNSKSKWASNNIYTARQYNNKYNSNNNYNIKCIFGIVPVEMYILVNLFNFLFHYNPLLIPSCFPTLAVASAIVICMLRPFNVALGYITHHTLYTRILLVRFSLDSTAATTQKYRILFYWFWCIRKTFLGLFMYTKLNKVGLKIWAMLRTPNLISIIVQTTDSI